MCTEKGRTSCLRVVVAKRVLASGVGLRDDRHEDQRGERKDTATHGARGLEWLRLFKRSCLLFKGGMGKRSIN